MTALLLAAVSPALLGATLTAPAVTPVPRGFLLDEITAGGETLRYALYVPREYDAARRWPLVVALHGRGECGSDGLRQLTQGLAQAIAAAPADWPALALFPQKPDPEREWEEYEAPLLALIERQRGSYAIDGDRLYLTGLSQGGHGAWVLAARQPRMWAALVPICGYSTARVRDAQGRVPPRAYQGSADELVRPLVGLPVWAFHGVQDSIIPAAQSEELVAALRAAGGEARLTLFPGVDHGAWDPAYRDPALARWLLAQRRRTPSNQQIQEISR